MIGEDIPNTVLAILHWQYSRGDEKLDMKTSFFPYNFAKHGLAKLLIIYLTTRDHPRLKPHGPRPAGDGGT